MFLSALTCISAFSALAACKLDAGLYRIQNKYYPQSLAAQIGLNIQTVGGQPSDDVRVTWFIAPAAGHVRDAHTIQNVQSLQYLSVDGNPSNGSILVPSDAPFVWTVFPTRHTFGVGNLTVGSITSEYLTLLLNGTDPSQYWNINGVQPFGGTYRIWHPLTDTYLAGSSTVPGTVTAKNFEPHNALQYWTVAGTGAGSREGSIVNVKTGGFLAITSGTVGTFSTAKPSGRGSWFFGVEGGRTRLTARDAASPNVVAVNLRRRVVAEAEQDSGAQQIFVFVPADASNTD
ncbi:hypothetical protein AURDEDRAFT_171985 [Auricularia subglabra TFB-10046 SS5]|nr:hypothetical protein AURDEDRAFT_171985 [Auricularia subglabra TFB-10046 SS5]